MFRSRTVFILGAGASAEVGLPIGSELLDQICDLVNIRYDFSRMVSGDHQVSEALKMHLAADNGGNEYSEHLRAAWQVIESSNQGISIDNIVDGLEDEKTELIAKLGIVRAIHAAEKKSRYFHDDRNRPDRLNFRLFTDTWYGSLTKLICEGRRRSELEGVFDNLAFVSFNYDRCIENYLPRSIANYFGVGVEQVIQRFNSVPIHRPYGVAGRVEINRQTGVVRGFGGLGAEYLADAAGMIRTFTQGVENPESLQAMKDEISNAERIVFLGSAFHRQNLELLRSKIRPSTRILATASGISDSDKDVVLTEMSEIFGVGYQRGRKLIEFAPMFCKDLFNSYWRTLTA